LRSAHPSSIYLKDRIKEKMLPSIFDSNREKKCSVERKKEAILFLHAISNIASVPFPTRRAAPGMERGYVALEKYFDMD